MLDDVREGFRDQEIGSELDDVGQAIPGRAPYRHRERRPPRERLDRRQQSLLSQQGRMNAAGELAQLRDRLVDLVARALEHVRAAAILAPCRDAERQGKRHEPLLGTVVEIAFDSTPLGVGRRDDAGARRAHLGELRAHLCRQALVLEHEPRRCSNGLHKRRLVQQRRVVHERSNLLTSHGHERDRPLRALRKLQRPTCSVHVTAIFQAIDDVDGRVAEHVGETLPQTRRSVRPQLYHEVGCLRSPQSRPRQSGDDAEWNEQREPAIDRDDRRRALTPRGHPGERENERRNCDRGGGEQRCLRASWRSAQHAQTAHEQPQHAERDGDAQGSLDAVDGVGDRPLLRDSQHVARVRRDEDADELTAERRQIGAGDRTTGGGRPGATLGEGQHDVDEDGHPGRVEQVAERPQDIRIRPLEIRGEQRECGEDEQGAGAPPAPPLQGDEGSRDESPRQREIRSHARARGAGVDSEPADGEARDHDCRRKQHRVAQRARCRRGQWRGSTTSCDKGGECRR